MFQWPGKEWHDDETTDRLGNPINTQRNDQNNEEITRITLQLHHIQKVAGVIQEDNRS